MEPTEVAVARELAEELRSNNKLRHRLGMEDGAEATQLDGSEADTVAVSTRNGSFFIKVELA